MKTGPVTNLGSIGGAPDPTTAPEVATGMNKLHADQGYSQSIQPVSGWKRVREAVRGVVVASRGAERPRGPPRPGEGAGRV